MKKTGKSSQPSGSNAKAKQPKGGGDPVRQAQQWGGGSKGSKGKITPEDRRNENSSAKS